MKRIINDDVYVTKSTFLNYMKLVREMGSATLIPVDIINSLMFSENDDYFVMSNIDEEEMKSAAERMMSDSFNYNDLLKQFKMIKRMGSLSKIMGFLPGMGKMKAAMNNVDDKAFDKIEA